LAYTIIAETRNQRLLGDQFTADTAHEAFGGVQDIRRRGGGQVKITGPDGDPVSENGFEAKAAGSRSARARPAPSGTTEAGSEQGRPSGESRPMRQCLRGLLDDSPGSGGMTLELEHA
jgi:hypothetical protein